MLETIASILTIVGFIITIWQLVVFGNKLKKNTNEVKEAQKQLIHLAKVSDAIRLIELIQEHLMEADCRVALYRTQELKKALNEINGEGVVRNNVRDNYDKLLISFSERYNSMQQAVLRKEDYNPSFFLETLQGISDNLQLVQKQLKK